MLDKFLANFDYEPDGWLDSWNVLSIEDDEAGDCDDHAATTAYIVSGGWLMFWVNVCLFRMKFLRVLTGGGVTHIILKYKGRYIDNITGEWRYDHAYKPIFPWIILPPIVAWKLFLGKIVRA